MTVIAETATRPPMAEHPSVRDMVQRLEAEAADALVAVVLYGPAAHGDVTPESHEVNLLLVLRDLELQTLDRIGGPVRHWLKHGFAMPRLLARASLAEAADVFPIEFLDIAAHRIVLSGTDPFPELTVHKEHLRVQCERELREKMMRLREAYLEAKQRPKLLSRLMTESYLTFAELFRGCLRLVIDEPPLHGRDVVRTFCRRVGLDDAPFSAVDALCRRQPVAMKIPELFHRYYAELSRAVTAIDRLDTEEGT